MGLLPDWNEIIGKLAESPVVADAMKQFTETRNGIIQAMNHFNERFDRQDAIMTSIATEVITVGDKSNQILFLLQHPSDVAPAADDGLMALLAADGQEMKMQEITPVDDKSPTDQYGNSLYGNNGYRPMPENHKT